MSDLSKGIGSKGGIAGWIKAAIASLLSAGGAAVFMYASPWVDSVIKPAKPVANFQAQASGLKVVFQNKSIGGHEGWWDFGDGSALEPFVPEEPTVAHNYAKAGNYPVKLTLKNLLNEENERLATVAVAITEPGAPVIETFEVVATRGDYAPAMFRIATKVRNADMCVWALGNRPIEFSPETAKGEEKPKVVTFKEPGTHVIRLAAFNGKQSVEKIETVVVKPAPAGMVSATVAMTYEAILVETKITPQNTQLRFPADQKGTTAKVTHPIPATHGFEIVQASFLKSSKPVDPKAKPVITSANLEIDKVKHDKVILTCEMVRPTVKSPPPSEVVSVSLTEQRKSPPAIKTTDPVMCNLNVPGTSLVPLPPLPAGWVIQKQKTTLTLQQDGRQVGFFDSAMPQNVAVPISGGIYNVTAVEQAGQLRIDVLPKKQ